MSGMRVCGGAVVLCLLFIVTLTAGARAGDEASNHRLTGTILSIVRLMLDGHTTRQSLLHHLTRRKTLGVSHDYQEVQTVDTQFDGAVLLSGDTPPWLELDLPVTTHLAIRDLVRVFGQPLIVWPTDREPEVEFVYRERGLRRWATISAQSETNHAGDFGTDTYAITIKIKTERHRTGRSNGRPNKRWRSGS